MQFVTDGPDIPDALLQAHEEGSVVFFCGAGISYPAGLQDFKWLVEQVYKSNGENLSEIERDTFNRGQFDATLDLLERRLTGQRMAVRRALEQALKPKLRRKGALDTQIALLNLSRKRDRSLRLVTTNFDRLFHAAAKRTGQPLQVYSAPMLPIPKNSRWNGLVHLHGLLPDKQDDTALNRLVVTSGDFGLAYLTERWAARFVSELFRNYVVCFVGYSINDPVLRYMMDALAADRMLGEVTPQAWALVECEPGQKHHVTIEWEAKGVTPILYDVPLGRHDHSALHNTLHSWSETYQDGVLGKERMVVNYALAKPSASTLQDDFMGRMMWALSDESGLPAKRFAEFNPVPKLDWLLDAFSLERYQQSDLIRFRVTPQNEREVDLRFSLINRPTPYHLSPRMTLAFAGMLSCQWDDVMFHLARWLVRHLNDPRLIIWIAERGGQLHDRFISLIDYELERLAKLEVAGDIAELDEIRAQAPNAIPCMKMRNLWRMLISGRVKSRRHDLDLYRWKDRFEREGLTSISRMELRELLKPQVALRKPFRWGHEEDSIEPESFRHLVDWEIILYADNVHAVLREINAESWHSVLPIFLTDFQQLLSETLELMQELGEANEHNDRSYWDLPSISPHWQNRGYHEWVCLIELLRDSWLETLVKDASGATKIAQAWFEKPYPTFKRLALFAASHDNCIECLQWVGWLLVDGSRWLWSIDTSREVYRLLVLQGNKLVGSAQELLETAILAGPPRGMYLEELEEESWQNLVSRSVWLHLAKLSESGVNLTDTAQARFAELSNANPQSHLHDNERDEFLHWMIGAGDPDYEESSDIDIAPRKRQELLQWLTKSRPVRHTGYEDSWRDVCRTRFFHSLFALCDLAKGGNWPTERWREALQTWSEDALYKRSWHYAAPLISTMPDSLMQEIAHALTWWIQAVSNSVTQHEEIFLHLCQRIMLLPLEISTGINMNGEPIRSPVTESINHPIGHITQALTTFWFKQNPSDNDLLPPTLQPIFLKICDIRNDGYRHGRVILASNLIAFFRVDRIWTEQNMLPLFNWVNPVEARAAWEGFLWSPRLHQPLLIVLKTQLLECSNHYTQLGEHRKQFAFLLTYMALDQTEGYSTDEFKSALEALPNEGIEASAQALSQAIEGAADKSEDYWKNRVQPFWKQIWPKSGRFATPRIAESFARLMIACGDQFPVAYNLLQDWLKPIAHADYVVRQLHESGLCMSFPEESLRLLHAIIPEQHWAPLDLGKCLEEIGENASKLLLDDQYQKLQTYFRRRGF